MEGTWYFIVFLFLFTMGTFLIWAWLSKTRTERKLAQQDAPKSSLATDGPGPNPVTAPREGYTPPGASDGKRADLPKDRQRA